MIIICQKENCGGTIAHIKGKAVEIMRSKNSERSHRIVIVGRDFSAVATCPRCFEQTAILIEDGKINLDQLNTQEEPQNEQEPTEPTEAPESAK